MEFDDPNEREAEQWKELQLCSWFQFTIDSNLWQIGDKKTRPIFSIWLASSKAIQSKQRIG